MVQRGNNKGEVFSDSSDYPFFLKLLRHESLRCDVAIHAYALMTESLPPDGDTHRPCGVVDDDAKHRKDIYVPTFNS